MITTIRKSAPTPKSMPWPRPHRPAQAPPVRRESVPVAGKGDGQGVSPSVFGLSYCPIAAEDQD
jgi:hypothetical protein